MADDEVLKRVELALAQAKHVRTAAAFTVKQLAQLRDHLQPNEAQGEQNAPDEENSR